MWWWSAELRRADCRRWRSLTAADGGSLFFFLLLGSLSCSHSLGLAESRGKGIVCGDVEGLEVVEDGYDGGDGWRWCWQNKMVVGVGVSRQGKGVRVESCVVVCLFLDEQI